MARRLTNKLTAAMVKQATKPGYLSDGSGLVLQIGASGAKSWLFRYRSPAGRVREMGLGSASTVGLAAARLKAQEAQRQRDDGSDPLEVKRQREAQALLDASKNKTFKWCAEQYVEAHASGWRNAKHAAQWSATLEEYAYPTMGNLPVASIDVTLVTGVLEPIWSTKHETATRVRQRIERVLSWATAREYRSGENPARWRGHLDQILPKPEAVRKTQPVKHHRALPADDVPALMGALAEREGGSALALRFLALTASRTGEVVGATWPEIDMVARLWTIPGSRMKGGEDHRIPLSDAAMDILRGAAKTKVNDVVFSGQTPGRPLSNMAMLVLLKRMKRTDFVPHGLRSTFRTWCAEKTNYPREVCEAALSHSVGNNVELAYKRTDFLDRRKRLMADWARFATSTPANATGGRSVVSLRSRKA